MIWTQSLIDAEQYLDISSIHGFLLCGDNYFGSVVKNLFAPFINFSCLEASLGGPWVILMVCSIC